MLQVLQCTDTMKMKRGPQPATHATPRGSVLGVTVQVRVSTGALPQCRMTTVWPVIPVLH